MKREEIRREVDRKLCELGYSLGWRHWRGATLHVMRCAYQPRQSMHLPSGISRKRLAAALAALPPSGPPRKRPRVLAVDFVYVAGKQLDLVGYLLQGRAA